MAKLHPSPAAFAQPKVSVDKIIKRMRELQIHKYHIADALKISPSFVTRGLRSLKWVSARISELSVILKVAEAELFEDQSDLSWVSPLERGIGKPGKDGYSMPGDYSIRVIFFMNRWEKVLVAPPTVVPADGDLVILAQADPESPLGETRLVGRIYQDVTNQTQWVINAGSERIPRTVPKSTILSIRIVIASVGEKAWGER